MMETIAACIQLNSGNDRKHNHAMAKEWMDRAVDTGARLLILPENFAFMGQNDTERQLSREDANSGESVLFLRQYAKERKVWVVGGSILLMADDMRATNTTLVIDDQGEVRARYDKIHLFDVNLVGEKKPYCESAHIVAGHKAVVVDTPFGCLGLAICYDLRFPELFRQLATMGAQMVVIPAAFTLHTGKDHWEVLLRARAIENWTYVLASAQDGMHPGERRTYGHSMIIEPWGTVVARAPSGVGMAWARIEPQRVIACRAEIPSLEHRVLF